jgi:hypothetical protein
MGAVVRFFLVVSLLLVGLAPVAGASPDGAGVDAVLQNTLPLNSVVPGTDISGLGGVQYRNNNQRNFWWNAAAGRWDGILPTASPPAAASSQWWFWHDLAGASPTPIGLSEPGSSSTPDAYWHEPSKTLYVFYSRGSSGTSRFRRYLYDQGQDRYIEVSRTGGVSVPEGLRGGPRVTIIRSPNGHLWAGVNNETNQILVSRSTDNGDTWASPVALKQTAIKGEGHWVELNVGGTPHVAFAATEDGLAPGGNPRVHFLRISQDEPNWTNPARWTDETSSLPPWEGGERADDELSAVTFENRAFVVIETEPLGDSRSAARPQLVVFERQTNGVWRKHVIERFTSKGGNDAKRPVVTVDASARLLVVTAGTTANTHADMWYAPIDSLVGRDGQWPQLRIFEVSNASAQNIYNTRLPLPRFPVTAQSNLLTMIDDRGSALNLWRQIVTSSGVTEPPPDPSMTVSITNPQAGSTVSGAVLLQANASNATEVEFFVDGTTLGTDRDASNGWSAMWNTTASADGSRTLTAVARNAAGTSVTSAPVSVSVSNSSGDGEVLTLEIPVRTTNDDVEERSNGRIWTSQSNLDLMTDVSTSGADDIQRAVGLRFTGVTVPNGATIIDARVQFQADKATSVPTNLSITGHASDDATAFTTTKYEVTARPRTSASVAWEPPAWLRRGDRDAAQRTSNLAPVLQELVARPGWRSGNALSLIVEGAGERVAASFDGGLHSPTLQISYRTTAPPGNNEPPVISSVVINESTPRTNDTLTVRVQASDPNGNQLTYRYEWFRNGIPLTNATGATLDLSVPGNGDKDDQITVRVTASDGKVWSEPVTSAPVTVVNSTPVFDQNLADRTNGVGDTISLSAAATDADDDPLTYAATGLPSGLAINTSTGLITGAISGAANQYNTSITVTDGTASPAPDTFRWTVTVDQPPAAPTGLTAAGSTSTEVVLDWNDSPESEVTGYHVYRSASPSGPYAKLTSTALTTSAYADASAPPGTSYYRVTAVSARHESAAAALTVAGRIVLRSTSTATARNASSITLARPAGVTAGDVLIASVGATKSGNVTAPTGWTVVRSDANGTAMRQAVFSRVATASEPSSYTFGLPSGSSAAAAMASYRGVDPTTPIDAHGGQVNASSGQITAPAVTTTGPNRLLIGFFGVVSSATNGITPPDQMVERADVTQGQGKDKIVLEAADQVLFIQGPTGTRTATVGSAGANVGQLVSLRPAP